MEKPAGLRLPGFVTACSHRPDSDRDGCRRL